MRTAQRGGSGGPPRIAATSRRNGTTVSPASAMRSSCSAKTRGVTVYGAIQGGGSVLTEW
ncbi:hypothetical protein PQR15_32845 [Streptomyces lydicus]|nr:hypothetical protein [Streptomyces lydicus]